MTHASLVWPFHRSHEAVEAVARLGGLIPTTVPSGAALRRNPSDAGTVARSIESTAQQLGLEAEPVDAGYRDLDAALAHAAPALWNITPRDDSPGGLVALLGCSRRTVRLVDPDLNVRRIPLQQLRGLLAGGLEDSAAHEVGALLADAPLDRRARPNVHAALVRERLSHATVGGCWMLRLPPGAPFLRQLREAGVVRSLVALIGLHAAQQMFWIIAWWIIGASALLGRTDPGRLSAWTLIVAAIVLLRLQSAWTSGRLLYITGGLLKRRLLAGILRLDAGDLHRQGSGRLLGQVLESSAIEQLILAGGFNTALALIEMLSALFVLAIGPTPGLHLPLLAFWLVFAALGTWFYSSRRRAWTAARLAVTQQLVERLAGHRTRIAQESPAQWHEGEDEALDEYARIASRLDGSALAMSTLVRTWIFAALLAILPAIAYSAQPATAIAVGIGGILMAAQALARFNAGVGSLVGAMIAGGQIRELFRAARAEMPAPARDVHPSPTHPALEARGLRFQYPGQPEPILRHCNLTLAPGERLLLEGPSGCGKSTLAKLLGALIEPQAGLILLGGLDRPSLGRESWRRRVNVVPALHENHILTGSLAFNVLLGRDWPPAPGDLPLADRTCRELGLGPLLDRMPAGILQLVGETGWQLSQGEKSRVFLARALLADGDVFVLDESFGSLDPLTLRQCMHAIMQRPQAALLIAHR